MILVVKVQMEDGDGPEDFLGGYKEVFKMPWRSELN